MARVIISLLAQSDTAHIVTKITETAGYQVAAKYAANFEALYNRLALFPDSGPRRPAVGKHVRMGIVLPYIILYKHAPASDDVIISRIIHGRQKITGKLLRGA